MFYYAYLNANDICEQIYALPAAITSPQFIPIGSNDQTLVGQKYDRVNFVFVPMYYYAILNDKSVVSETVYFETQQQTTATMRAITFAQYQTVKGLYWNGTEYVTPPISIAALASTNTVNYKDEDKWLSTKLDEMDSAISGNSTSISTLSTNLSTVATDMQTVVQSVNTLATVVEGKANAVHTHTSADLSGVVKTVNGNAPDANGNITVTNSGMTADEILTAVKTVDGTNSGLDADMLDGLDSTAFAPANHTHENYATTSTVSTIIAGAIGSVTADIDAVETALDDKANVVHNHDTVYAPLTHEHAQSDITGLATALNGKANAVHTHNEYLPASGGTVGGNLNVNGIVRVNNQQCLFDSGTMVTVSTNNRETMIAGSKIYSKVAISVSSDERLKENVKDVSEGDMTDFIKGIDVKEFNYLGSEEKFVGVIAQDIIRKSPVLADYFVRTDNEGFYSVKASDLVFPLITAVQELYKRIEK